MAFEIIDLTEFLDNGMVSEAFFLNSVEQLDWNRYRDKRVLVKGCGSTIIPPWAFMVITARLVPIARSVSYGNDHDNLRIFRRSSS